MTAEQFAYWFQGFAELSETPPTQAQWDSMREHVATVFVKVTPSVNVQFDADHGKKLADCIGKWPSIPDFVRSPAITC